MREPQKPNTVRIDILDVEASAGNGAYLSPTEQGLLSQEFDLTFFRQQFGRADTKYLKLITVKGDSMAPTLESGDLLYVDISENYFAADGLYVFTFDGQTFISVCKKWEKKCSSFPTTQPTKNGRSRKMTMCLSTAG